MTTVGRTMRAPVLRAHWVQGAAGLDHRFRGRNRLQGSPAVASGGMVGRSMAQTSPQKVCQSSTLGLASVSVEIAQSVCQRVYRVPPVFGQQHLHEQPQSARRAQAVARLVSTKGRADLTACVDQWIANVPYEYRKQLIHFGALSCRSHRDPVHFIDETTGMQYFDPTNRNYAKAYYLMTHGYSWPFYNNNTIGDVEALIGLSFLQRRVGHHVDSISAGQHRLAERLELLCYIVYSISRLFLECELLSPQDWAVRVWHRLQDSIAHV